MDTISDYLMSNIARLFKQIGNPDFCKGCGKKIWWVKHLNGKNTPYTETALNHFIDCPKSNQFRMNLNSKNAS